LFIFFEFSPLKLILSQFIINFFYWATKIGGLSLILALCFFNNNSQESYQLILSKVKFDQKERRDSTVVKI